MRGLELVASSLLALVTLGSTGAISAVKRAGILKDGDEGYSSSGCYVDSKRNRIMSEREVAKPMSAKICFEICKDQRYTHFGTQYGDECWCAKDPWLKANGGKVSSSECDMSCARSDTREKCGGHNRISVYEMKGEEDDDHDDPRGEKSYKSEGCYKDSGRNRIMPEKHSRRPMSAEICYDICDDGHHTHFGTQYGRECWCAEDPHLDTNGGKVSSRECDMDCAGSRTDENCGDRDRMSVYKFVGGRGEDEDEDEDGGGDDEDEDEDGGGDDEDEDEDGGGEDGDEDEDGRGEDGDEDEDGGGEDGDEDEEDEEGHYIGCYADKSSRRAMPDETFKSNRMTPKVCVSNCSYLGYKYAGAQYGRECWCSDKYDEHGESTHCNMPCAGDHRKMCGGRNALSVYRVD